MQGGFSTAVPLLEKAVEIYKFNLGEFHSTVESTVNNLQYAIQKLTQMQNSN